MNSKENESQKKQTSRAGEKKLISVVVPAFNEESVIEEFYSRLTKVATTLPNDFEIVFVNDGSTDKTLELFHQFAEDDSNVSVVNLSRNFGKEIALTAGLDHARGDAVIVIDADLQDPPELIPLLIETWENDGYDVVYARRSSREGETWLKKATAALFYRFMSMVGRVKIPRDTGDFRLLSRRAVDAVCQLREQHRFMKGLFAWVGYSQAEVLYSRDARFAGESKWNYLALVGLSIEAFTSFTLAPLKLATISGVLTALAAFVYGTIIIIQTLLYGNAVPGYPSLVVIVLFMGGIQLISIGILGEYLGRVFNETKRRPLYFVENYRSADVSDKYQGNEAVVRQNHKH